jgi:hypothetical protein
VKPSDTNPAGLSLPSLVRRVEPPPRGGAEREKILRGMARDLAERLGPATAVHLAALPDEAAEEMAGSGEAEARLEEREAP